VEVGGKMPFIPNEERQELFKGNNPVTPGQMCYLEYVKLINAWKAERRWTTAHNEFKRVFDVDDAQAAKTLAYLVFLIKKVMIYEDEKEKENGTIE